MVWKSRHLELLSDGEWVGALFSTMLTNLVDVREQSPISLEDGPSEISLYDARHLTAIFPGTLNIARQLGFKHPRVYGDGTSDDWQMTTDQVLMLKRSNGTFEILAVSYKSDLAALTKRDRQLLAIEKEYWNARGVTWILITADLFEELVGLTLRGSAPWALGSEASVAERQIAIETVAQTIGHTFTYTVNSIEARLGDKDLAQRSLWQAIWSGEIPMDLRRGWRPHHPIKLLSHDAFAALNPVAARRTSWN